MTRTTVRLDGLEDALARIMRAKGFRDPSKAIRAAVREYDAMLAQADQADPVEPPKPAAPAPVASKPMRVADIAARVPAEPAEPMGTCVNCGNNAKLSWAGKPHVAYGKKCPEAKFG